MEKITVRLNDVFNGIRVLEFAGVYEKNHSKLWRCRCHCGKEFTTRDYPLKTGKTKSCGCIKNKKLGDLNRTHGDSRTNRLHHIWRQMRYRCKNYKWYADVSICPEWDTYEEFKKWATSNGYGDNLTIERIDPYGNYEPNNCTWIPQTEQPKNRRQRGKNNRGIK